MLYFHPWEFDPSQPRLPLGLLDRWRTYVGLRRSRPRLRALLSRHRFARAIDVVRRLEHESPRSQRSASSNDQPINVPPCERRGVSPPVAGSGAAVGAGCEVGAVSGEGTAVSHVRAAGFLRQSA
jgi:hypothetical protein